MTWYTSDATYDTALAVAFAIVAVAAAVAPFVRTPYGRFADKEFGVSLDPRLGWFLMELPASVVFVYFYVQGEHALAPLPLFVFFVWIVHYANRGFIMPQLMRVPRGQKTTFSLFVVAIGWVVTSLHGYLNAVWASSLSPQIGWEWFGTPHVIVGVLVYYAALAANIHSDHIVRNLRTAQGGRGRHKGVSDSRGRSFPIRDESELSDRAGLLGRLCALHLEPRRRLHPGHQYGQPDPPRDFDQRVVSAAFSRLPVPTEDPRPLRLVAPGVTSHQPTGGRCGGLGPIDWSKEDNR